MTESEHAAALIRAFVVPERRARLLGLLASERGRDKLRRGLAHFDALDTRYARRLPGAEQTPEGNGRALRDRGAPARCVLLAEDAALDGRQMLLDEALEAIVGRGMGAFLSCVPGRLAYFEGEDLGERYLLERTG